MSQSHVGNNGYLGKSLRLAINDSSGVSEARRMGTQAAREHGFNEEMAGRVALVITEAGNNIARHARNGMVVLRRLSENGARGLEILALDQGPGMENVNKCMVDGYSTAGTSGTGLGAIRRMSGVFDIHSRPGVGTALLSQIWTLGNGAGSHLAGATGSCAWQRPGSVDYAGVSVAMGDAALCGDAWAVRRVPDSLTVMVADGLGHGPLANEAAMEAVRVFGEAQTQDLLRVMEAIHGALKKTRGAAVALVTLDAERDEARFVGVGNIAGSVVHGEKSRPMVSFNGTVGHHIHKTSQFVYPWAPDSLVVLNSDGLASQWSVARYGQISARHPGLAAGMLYRDFGRERDDTTVVTVSRVG